MTTERRTMSIVRFTGAPGTGLYVDNLHTLAGLVPRGGVFEASDEEIAKLRALQFTIDDVDESELSDAEKDSIVYLPEEAEAEEPATAASPANIQSTPSSPKPAAVSSQGGES
jgi:hypothetical protein